VGGPSIGLSPLALTISASYMSSECKMCKDNRHRQHPKSAYFTPWHDWYRWANRLKERDVYPYARGGCNGCWWVDIRTTRVLGVLLIKLSVDVWKRNDFWDP
jgi:hypothetical protein